MLMENSPNADLEVCFYDGKWILCESQTMCLQQEVTVVAPWVNAHLCVNMFHEGAKTHKTPELVRVVEKSGKSYTVKGEVGLSGLSPESRLYVELSDEGHSMCLSLEAAITAEEQRSTKNVPFFPITIGRWGPVCPSNMYWFYFILFLGGKYIIIIFILGDLPTQTPRVRQHCPPSRHLRTQLHLLIHHISLLQWVSHGHICRNPK